MYKHEMTEADHQRMLDTIIACEGSVMLSGYPNEMYDEVLSQWNRHDFEIDNKVSGSKTKGRETEAVWCNF